MKKENLILIVLFISIHLFSQNEKSSTRMFIDDAKFTRINKDWTTKAEFRSGIGEYVNFYPVEVIDLKSGKKMNALQLDMYIKDPEIYKRAWVGFDEIEEFIIFIESYIIPRLGWKYKDRSSEFVFQAKEMTLSYIIDERVTRISIKVNNYEGPEFYNYTFWTKTQVDKIPELLEILKVIK